MSWTTAIEGAILVVLVAASAFFAAAEIAYFSLNPIQIHRIRRYRPQAARRIEEFLATPTQILSALLIGNTVVNITAANIGFAIAVSFFPDAGETIAIPAMTLIILIFGEVAPKRYTVRRAEQIAVRLLPLTGVVMRLLSPARLWMDRVTRSFDKHFQGRSKSMTEAEFMTAVDVSHEEGVLTKEELAMVDGIIRLESMHASDVMTPRVDTVGIDIEAPLAEGLETARHARLRYLPVYRGTLDHVEGFLDVFKFLVSPGHDIRASMLRHFYVPDTAPLDSLLTIFQHENLHIAIVIDEYGGTAGLITRGDILEEIVHDVENEYGDQRLRIEEEGPGRWRVDGAASLADINHQLDLSLEAEGAERIAGWVGAQVGVLPKTGDVIEAQGCRATVLEVKKHRIRALLIEKI